MTVKADIRNRTLRRLTVIGEGETASPDDASIVDDGYTSLYQELVTKRLASWGSGASDTIPEQYVEPLIAILASRYVDDFSVPDSKKVSIVSNGRQGWDALRGYSEPDQDLQPVRVTNY